MLACSAVVIASVTALPLWRPAVDAAGNAPQPVRIAPAGQKYGAKPGTRGATDEALERQIVRQTTRFADAVAVAERTLDGDIQATLTGRSGGDLGRLKVDRISAGNDLLQYFAGGAASGEAPLQAYGESGTARTLEWANRQAYHLWKDDVHGADAKLEWQNGVMRRRGAARRELDRDILEVETEWANGMSARAVRKTVRRHRALPTLTIDDDVVVTHLKKDGTELGVGNWYETNRVFVWDLPGLSHGYITAEHLKAIGGWTFVPDMAWLNTQTAAFHHYKTLINKNGFVARSGPSWPSRLVEALVPTLHANEPGCDGLHWLDGTTFRYCCDVHDLCYERYGCNYMSWWKFWSSWTCDYCNSWAVVCMVTGAGYWTPAV
jgi:hypothetical protein